MKQIGSYDAKTHLPGLLKEVLKGECFIITRHGIPIAKLSPIDNKSSDDIKKKIEELKEFRKGRKLGDLSLRDMISEGRRF